MDVAQLDQSYAQLQQQGQQTAANITTLAQKLQTAADSGNQDAREWALDLKEIALAIRDEEGQMSVLLQGLHTMVDQHIQQTAVAPQPQYVEPQYAQPQYAPAQPQYQQPQYAPQGGGQQAGGMLHKFLGSGFGRSIAMGAGFGIGDDIVNDIFH